MGLLYSIQFYIYIFLEFNIFYFLINLWETNFSFSFAVEHIIYIYNEGSHLGLLYSIQFYIYIFLEFNIFYFLINLWETNFSFSFAVEHIIYI